MIKPIENLPDNIIGFRYEGEVTNEDYKTVLYPVVEAALKKTKELKMLLEITESFAKFTLHAAWDDAAIGFKYFRDWKKIAFLSDKEWLNHTIKALSFLTPGQSRTFATNQMEEAISWLKE